MAPAYPAAPGYPPAPAPVAPVAGYPAAAPAGQPVYTGSASPNMYVLSVDSASQVTVYGTGLAVGATTLKFGAGSALGTSSANDRDRCRFAAHRALLCSLLSVAPDAYVIA